jgi:hypothetical protein
VRERRCFVQFIHPGGEHWPDRGDRKFWNREAHRRKFLKGRGRYITGGEAREGEIVFWGEWEPESRVLARYSDRVADGPHFLYEPFFVDHRDGAWRQNTDPFVFGERFQLHRLPAAHAPRPDAAPLPGARLARPAVDPGDLPRATASTSPQRLRRRSGRCSASFPGRPYDQGDRGFARPEIRIPGTPPQP